MATRKVFYDKNGCELECYINEDNRLYIGINENRCPSNYVTLDIADARELIAELIKYREEMENL